MYINAISSFSVPQKVGRRVFPFFLYNFIAMDIVAKHICGITRIECSMQIHNFSSTLRFFPLSIFCEISALGLNLKYKLQ